MAQGTVPLQTELPVEAANEYGHEWSDNVGHGLILLGAPVCDEVLLQYEIELRPGAARILGGEAQSLRVWLWAAELLHQCLHAPAHRIEAIDA